MGNLIFISTTVFDRMKKKEFYWDILNILLINEIIWKVDICFVQFQCKIKARGRILDRLPWLEKTNVTAELAQNDRVKVNFAAVSLLDDLAWGN